MKDTTLRFKTNINCGGCVASVKPHLDQAEGLAEWHVDTDHPDKILNVTSAGITEAGVLAVIQKTGFKAEPLVE